MFLVLYCIEYCIIYNVARIALSVQRLATCWTVRGSNHNGDEIFRTRPDRPWGPASLLYNGYRISLPELKRLGRGVNNTPHLSPRLKKEYSYTYSPLCAFVESYRVKFTFYYTQFCCILKPFANERKFCVLRVACRR